MRGPIRSLSRHVSCALVVLWLALGASPTSRADGILQGLRDDVRSPSSSSSGGSDDDDRHHHYHDDDDDGGGFHAFVGRALFYGVTSPVWGPVAALDDDLSKFDGLYFPRFPYDHVPGYLMENPCEARAGDPTCAADPLRSDRWPARPRTWAARLRVEYATDFDDLQRIGGHLLLSTRTRFGLDTETSYFRERLPGDRHDHLWLGDCNVVYRFAQSEHAQFRTGIGFNWMDDPLDTNFGFNFTYGADFFPSKPWIVSSTIDWGTLESAELFRFRGTVGAILWGMEVYTGYEYLDVDSTQINALLAGVRIWF
jgi:hypothetical protein